MRFLNKIFDFSSSRVSQRSERKIRPGLEVLEDRLVMAATVPQHDSLVGAPFVLYLDFDGHFESQWGTEPVDATTPKFDVYDLNHPNHDPNDFDAQELALITDVWNHVAEDFAPFKINVTTVEPPASAFDNGTALRVAIGGSSQDWYGTAANGASVIGSLNSQQHANTVYVFTNYFGQTATWIGAAASHHAGHAIGLEHQSESGNAQVIPLMGSGGVDPNVERTIWWTGLNEDNVVQDDFVALATGLDLSPAFNGWGAPFRPDDHPNQIQSPSGTVYTGPFNADGLIGPFEVDVLGNPYPYGDPDADIDYFAVSLNKGLVGMWTVDVNVADVGPNLDARIEVYDSNGNFLIDADPNHSLDASVKLSDGDYWIAVMGHNRIGQTDPDTAYLDAGTYTISASFSYTVLDQIYELEPDRFFPLCDPLGPYDLDPRILDTLDWGSVNPRVPHAMADNMVSRLAPLTQFALDRLPGAYSDRIPQDVAMASMQVSDNSGVLNLGTLGQVVNDPDDLPLISKDAMVEFGFER